MSNEEQGFFGTRTRKSATSVVDFIKRTCKLTKGLKAISIQILEMSPNLAKQYIGEEISRVESQYRYNIMVPEKFDTLWSNSSLNKKDYFESQKHVEEWLKSIRASYQDFVENYSSISSKNDSISLSSEHSSSEIFESSLLIYKHDEKPKQCCNLFSCFGFGR